MPYPRHIHRAAVPDVGETQGTPMAYPRQARHAPIAYPGWGRTHGRETCTPIAYPWYPSNTNAMSMPYLGWRVDPKHHAYGTAHGGAVPNRASVASYRRLMADAPRTPSTFTVRIPPPCAPPADPRQSHGRPVAHPQNFMEPPRHTHSMHAHGTPAAHPRLVDGTSIAYPLHTHRITTHARIVRITNSSHTHRTLMACPWQTHGRPGSDDTGGG